MNSIVQWEVTQLRSCGLRLKAGELQPPQRGLLQTLDVGADSTSFKRYVRQVALWSPEPLQQSRRQLLLPIFDPQILRLDDTGTLVLAGIELSSREGRVWEFQQVWRCRPFP